LTSRERVLAAAHCQTPDKVPCDIGFGFSLPVLLKFRELTGNEWPDDYFNTDIRHVGFLQSKHLNDYNHYFENRVPKERTIIDEWGIAHVKSDHSDLPFDHIVSPLAGMDTELSAIADFPMPDLDMAYRYDNITRDISMLQQRGLATVAPLATSLFEIAWQLRGIEDFMVDMLIAPDKCECLLDRILAIRKEQIKFYTKAGADVIMLGDDVADQRGLLMSLPLWQDMFKPRLAELVRIAKESNKNCVVFYHSDGNMVDILPDLIDIGVDITNPVQPECMDPETVKREYGSKICMWGTIGVQSTLPFGTVQEVEQTVRRRIETCGKNGGLILSPAHMIEPEVPWENVVALYQAIEKYGYY
jgi:uroporphyrinogen decarboxylase